MPSLDSSATPPELSAENYGLAASSTSLDLSGIARLPPSSANLSLEDLEEFLKQTYCGTMSLEVDSIEVGNARKNPV